MRKSGSRVLWVAAVRRLDPGPGHRDARAGGPVPAGGERLPAADASPGQVLIPTLRSAVTWHVSCPGGLPAGVTLERVAEVTRGIPLAVALVGDLLGAGQDPELVLRPVPEPGRPSAVIRELAERYLTHAGRCVPLQEDVPLLYGLALLHSDRLDPDLLAALWDVDPADVASLIHAPRRTATNFVLYGGGACTTMSRHVPPAPARRRAPRPAAADEPAGGRATA